MQQGSAGGAGEGGEQGGGATAPPSCCCSLLLASQAGSGHAQGPQPGQQGPSDSSDQGSRGPQACLGHHWRQQLCCCAAAAAAAATASHALQGRWQVGGQGSQAGGHKGQPPLLQRPALGVELIVSLQGEHQQGLLLRELLQAGAEAPLSKGSQGSSQGH